MYFDVVPAEHMKLVALSGVHMRLAAECLVHIGNIWLVPASFHILFGQGICPWFTLLLPCVCWSERWSLRTTAVDNNIFFMEVGGYKYIG
jgi:hypothetical protein